MADPADKLARNMEALSHVTVPTAFLKKWLAEQYRRAAGRPVPDWKYPLPHERRPAGRLPISRWGLTDDVQ